MLYASDLPIAQSIIAAGDRFDYYASLVHALDGNVNAGILLNMFLRWQGKQRDKRDGWIYKSSPEIHHETGLTRAMQDTAIKFLEKKGLVKTDTRGDRNVKHFLFDWQAVTNVWNAYLSAQNAKLPPEPDRILPSSMPEPLLKAMARKFDEVYTRETDGLTFEWGEGKDSGKHMSAIKKLSHAIARRCKDRLQLKAKKENNDVLPEGFVAEVTELMVLQSWEQFLAHMPEYYLKNRLSPAMLLSDFPDIIKKATNAFKERNGQQPANNRPTRASAFGDVASDSV